MHDVQSVARPAEPGTLHRGMARASIRDCRIRRWLFRTWTVLSGTVNRCRAKPLSCLSRTRLWRWLAVQRYFSLLSARSGEAHAGLRQSTERLFLDVEGLSRCVRPEELHTVPRPDFWCFSMSLPRLFNTTFDTIPCDMPYLRPVPEEAERWAQWLPAGKPRVGFVWAVDPRACNPYLNAIDRRRSVSASTFLQLLRITGITFISFQKRRGKCCAIGRYSGRPAALRSVPDVTDFTDTAAIVTSLDLVMGVDTSVMHLAGAMNKPVWILSRFDGCWRWLRDRDDSPWYPSARVFRQRRSGDWDEVIEEVAQVLRDWAALHH